MCLSLCPKLKVSEQKKKGERETTVDIWPQRPAAVAVRGGGGYILSGNGGGLTSSGGDKTSKLKSWSTRILLQPWIKGSKVKTGHLAQGTSLPQSPCTVVRR